MARYAVVKGGVVENVVLADSDALAGPGAILSDDASPGDTYSGGVFTRPTGQQRVPAEVTKAQIVLALDAAGIDETEVDAVVAALPAGPKKKEARLRWKHAATVRRASPIVALLAAAKGLSESAVDDIFRNAETL